MIPYDNTQTYYDLIPIIRRLSDMALQTPLFQQKDHAETLKGAILDLCYLGSILSLTLGFPERKEDEEV